jgi:hypothetical protein
MQLYKTLGQVTAMGVGSLAVMMPFSAIASSQFIEIEPNRTVQQGLQFTVQRQVGQNPEVSRFAVEITPKTGQLPPQSKATLSVMNTAMNGFKVDTLREIDCATQDNKMICRFAVPNKTLKKSDLSFVFAVPVIQPGDNQTLEMLPENVMYFKLRPILTSPN